MEHLREVLPWHGPEQAGGWRSKIGARVPALRSPCRKTATVKLGVAAESKALQNWSVEDGTLLDQRRSLALGPSTVARLSATSAA